MDPNQNSPSNPNPQLPTNPPIPESQPLPAPQPQYFTEPIVEAFPQPQPVNTLPPTPTLQPVIQTPIPAVVQPVPQQFVANSIQPGFEEDTGSNIDKKHLKLFLIISAVVLAIAGVFVAVWLLFFNTLALKEYSNDDYSILIPESYKNIGYGSNIEYEKPDTESGYKSSVSVDVLDIPDGFRDEFISELKKQFTKESFESGGSMASFQDTSKVDVKDSKKDGMEIRTASGNVLDNDKVAGTFKIVLLISDSKAYTIAIMSHSTEPKLAASADAIINSFKEK